MVPTTHPLRLHPGDDLRQALEQAVATGPSDAAFVLAGIGSLTQAHIRYADAITDTLIPGPLEILSLCGSLTPQGAHLPDGTLTRERDPATGYLELVVRPKT